MKGIAQVFITLNQGGMYVHALGVSHDGVHPDWIQQYENSLGWEHLNPLVNELERRGFTKQPSTGYLLIFAKVTDDSALPAASGE